MRWSSRGPQPGAVLAGRWELVDRVGGGAMGAVWRAHDRDAAAGDREVALQLLADTAALDVVRAEVARSRAVRHRNLGRVLDVGEAGDLGFVTMELIEGETLRARVERGRLDGAARLTAAARLELVRQAIAGVAAAHAAGVVHRDLRPDAIVVDREGRAVVVELGLAAHAATRRRADTSQAYRPPEVGVASEVPAAPGEAAGDLRGDVFALGVIAVELLTGARPAAGAVVAAADLAVGDRLAGPLAALLTRAIAAEPADRPRSAVELADGLAALAPPRPARLRGLVVGAAVVVVAVAVALATWGALAGTPRPVPPVTSGSRTGASELACRQQAPSLAGGQARASSCQPATSTPSAW